MDKLSMTKPMVFASLIILSAYTPGALAAQDARACQKKCAEKMMKCLSNSSSMGISNHPTGMRKTNTKCTDDKQACERSCK